MVLIGCVSDLLSVVFVYSQITAVLHVSHAVLYYMNFCSLSVISIEISLTDYSLLFVLVDYDLIQL